MVFEGILFRFVGLSEGEVPLYVYLGFVAGVEDLFEVVDRFAVCKEEVCWLENKVKMSLDLLADIIEVVQPAFLETGATFEVLNRVVKMRRYNSAI